MCPGQSRKKINVSSTGNFVVAMKGLGHTEVGLGGELAASFLSNKILRTLIEVHTARFKDNMYEYDIASGKIAKTAVYTATVGPQYFITRKIALSVTVGPAWYKALDTEYHLGYGFKYSASSFLGSKGHLIAKIFTIHIPTKKSVTIYEGPILYMGIGIGYCF